MSPLDLEILVRQRLEMEFWEFLLQKEGDRSWLPLESPQVEILEGKYRVVARSSRTNTPVEVRIIHDATAEIPPVRRTQRRQGKINREGLIVIMPFTRLLPGVWQLRCMSDVMSDMMGAGWEHITHLHVLPIEPDISDEWDSDWDEGVTAADGIGLDQAPGSDSPLDSAPQPLTGVEAASDAPLQERPIPVTSTNPDPAASLLDQPLNQLSPNQSSQVTEARGASDLLPLAPRSSDGSVLSALPTLRLFLGQETYVIQRGQAVTLMGQVESVDELLTYELLPVEALEVRLYDPRTSQVLVEKRQPLTPRRLPFPFTCRITLPDSYQTYLVLGELILYGAADGNVPPPVLAAQSFNVTTDLHELIETIANNYADIELPAPPEASPTPIEDRQAEVSFPASQISVPEVSFKASSQQPLPPQLYLAEPDRENRLSKPPELPTFDKVTATDDERAVSEPNSIHSSGHAEALERSDTDGVFHGLESTTDAATLDEITDSPWGEPSLPNDESPDASAIPPVNGETHHPTQPAPPLTAAQAFDDTPIPNWGDDRAWDSTPPLTTERIDAAEPASPELDSPEYAAFRALNLQERFWERLQALMVDRELSAWLGELQAEENEETASEPDAANFLPLSRLKRRSIGKDAELAAQEVMAEDDPEQPGRKLLSRELPSNESTQPTMTLVLPLDEPVPMPHLEAQSGELMAGQTLSVTVKLPNLRPRVFVKLWLSERQSRSILESPRWLTDFLPDGFDHLITRTEINVPHGCVEVQVEAIAVEMATQRESDKATLVRQVIPADLSTFSLDEMDV